MLNNVQKYAKGEKSSESSKEVLPTCRICKNNTNHQLMNVKQTGKDKQSYFQYFFCHNCGSLSIVDIPNNLSEFYKGYYSYNPFHPNAKIRETLRYAIYKNKALYKLFHRILKSIYEYNLKSIIPLRLNKNAKILDVGSGSGKFVFDLHNLGFSKAIGIDPYLENNKEYKNGAIVYKKNFFEIDETYDLITFHHTLEHMNNLHEVCDQIFKTLKDNGVCIIRIPNIDSYAFKMFQEAWTGIHAPFHINLPSKKGLSEILEKHRLEIRKVAGEQSDVFFLSNIENQLDIINPDTMFVKFSPYWHTSWDRIYWKIKSNRIKHAPEKCEWIIFYVQKK